MTPEPAHRRILGVRIDATSYEDATGRILKWAREKGSRYVCVTSVHGVIESQDDEDFRHVQNNADLVTPDGMPLVWGLRLLGLPGAARVYGPELTLHVCQGAAREGIPIALYGGTPGSLDRFVNFLEARYPGIRIVCRISPPFRPPTIQEKVSHTAAISASGARIVLVGIGCPKQERWMAEHRGQIPGVMLGVGAAFDFHAGRVRQAPSWIQKSGLEWLFRLGTEPRRLWTRYKRIVPRFIGLFGAQYVRTRLTYRAGLDTPLQH